MALERVPNEVFLAEDRARIEADRAKEAAALAIARIAPAVIDVLAECLRDDDPQVRLRAADILLSRTVAKVAAKHVQDQEEVQERPDTAAIRESIMEQIKKLK